MNEGKNPLAFLPGEIFVKDERVVILRHTKGSVHLLGTHHNRANSAFAVGELIRIVKPHVVAVELCRTNLDRYSATEKPSSSENAALKRSHDMDFVPARLRDRAIGEELLLGLISESIKYERNCEYRRTLQKFASKGPKRRKFKVKPKVFHDVLIGQEMTVPFGDRTWYLAKPNSQYLVNESTRYRIMLADKPVQETFCNIASAVSAEERSMIKAYQTHFLRLFVTFSSSKTIMMSMLERNQRLQDAVLKERDEYMARSMRKALDDAKTKKNEIARVVGVVGKCHVPGIIKYWNGIICKTKKEKHEKRTAK